MGLVDRSDLRIWHISLEQIEATVSDFLGPGRLKGNKAGPTFSRHVSMYLARHVGGWSYPKISRFYNGRHHTTVLAAIRKIERLRTADESVDALLEVLTAALDPEVNVPLRRDAESRWRRLIIDAVAERVFGRDASHAVPQTDILESKANRGHNPDQPRRSNSVSGACKADVDRSACW